MRKLIRFAAYLGIGALFFVAGAAAWLRAELRASLPDDSGELALAGLTAPVTIERDALGVVTIRAASRLDEARALGFVHAQERFFQMDLLRRDAPDASLRRFAFKALSPVFDTHPFAVCGRREGGSAMSLWARDHQGALAMQAEAVLA